MTGISIETTLELWTSSLRAVKARMAPLFTQERVAASAGLFLDGLLGGERRKTGWMRAEAAGDPGPWRLSLSQTLSSWQLIENQAILSWDEGSLQTYWLDARRSAPVAGNA